LHTIKFSNNKSEPGTDNQRCDGPLQIFFRLTFQIIWERDAAPAGLALLATAKITIPFSDKVRVSIGM
jgi:hypothetical protein